MRDLAIWLAKRPGALAEMGEALGSAGVSIEGGDAFLVDDKSNSDDVADAHCAREPHDRLEGTPG